MQGEQPVSRLGYRCFTVGLGIRPRVMPRKRAKNWSWVSPGLFDPARPEGREMSVEERRSKGLEEINQRIIVELRKHRECDGFSSLKLCEHGICYVRDDGFGSARSWEIAYEIIRKVQAKGDLTSA